MIPKNWSFTPLSEILERVRKPVSVEHNAIYKEIGIRSHGKGIFYKEAKTGESLGNKSVFWIEPDCFILNIVFAWEQAIGLTTINEKGMIASHRFPMYKPKPNFLSLDYLLYFFMTPRGKYLLELASPGGAGRNKTLGQAEFLKLEILLPPLPEQRKIVEILSSWDKAIALLEQLITAKSKLKQGLMQQLLTGKKRFKEFESSEWQNELLGDFMIVRDGVHQTPTYTKSGVPFLRVTDIQNDKVNLSNTKYISKEEHEKLTAKFKPKNGDILYSKNGTIGITRIIDWDWEFSFFVSLALLRLRKDGYSVQYLAQYLQSNLAKREIYRGSKQGSVINLHLEEIQKFRVPIPPFPEQEKIASILSTADTEISNLEKQLAAYKQQKRGLMQQLLTGKKRVKIDEPQMQKV